MFWYLICIVFFLLPECLFWKLSLILEYSYFKYTFSVSSLFSFSSGILITPFKTSDSSTMSFFYIFDVIGFHFGKSFEVFECPHFFFSLSSLLTKHISPLFQLLDC